MTVTARIAHYVTSTRLSEIPADVRHEATRAIVDYVGCALGGARDESVERAIKALGPLSGPKVAAVIGRPERLDTLHASLMNGISAHVQDYDDATPKNYIHATSPIASALFSYASSHAVSGADILEAFILGFETTSRVGDCVYPAHYDAGWHITGTVGTIGAAAAIGKLLGLDDQQMAWAIGLAATQAAGLREMFGSMAKAFHCGRAAQNGYTAALLANEGFTASQTGLEGRRGFAAVASARYDLEKLTKGLGTDFGLRDNTYKAYACGLVSHSAIDACVQLRNEAQLEIESIVSMTLSVAPLVLELCGKKDISTGLEGKFSIYHSAAIAISRGKAGIAEFTDEAVNDPPVLRLRNKTSAVVDDSLSEYGGARLKIKLRDGKEFEKHVERIPGSLDRPLTDQQLDQKFSEQALLSLSARHAEEVRKLCWKIEQLEDVTRLTTLLATTKPE